MSKRAIARRLLDTLALHEAGVLLKREALRRQRPRASRSTIDRAIADWLADQPASGDLVVAAADSIVVLGCRLRVAKIGHLIALKLLARDDKKRPQDVVDLRALARVATAREWQRARAAVALIEKRGFARRRDLSAALERLRRSTAPGRVRR